MKHSSRLKFSLVLMFICLLSAGLLSFVYFLTNPKILAQKVKEEKGSLKEVLPFASSFKPIKKDEKILYYRGFDEKGNIVGYCFLAYGKGYSNTIETLVGIRPDGKISGIKILHQNETPGLGSRICEVKKGETLWEALRRKKAKGSIKPKRPWFQEQFKGKRVDELGRIEAISGATVSSQAVIDSVKEKIKEILELISRKH